MFLCHNVSVSDLPNSTNSPDVSATPGSHSTGDIRGNLLTRRQRYPSSNTAWQINRSRACTIFVVRPLRLRLCGLSAPPLATFWSRFPNDTRRDAGGGVFSLTIFLTNRSDPKKGA